MYPTIKCLPNLAVGKILWLVIFLMGLGFHPVYADSAPTFKEGTHYQKIRMAHPPEDASRVQVSEVFWYGCPHCYKLDPVVQAWRQQIDNDQVVFDRLPATMNRQWKIHARIYYTAESFDMVERLHPLIFSAIHEKGQKLLKEKEIASFFAAQGVERDRFDDTFHSFAVETKLTRATRLLSDYAIWSVPVMVVNGKYWTSPSLAGSYDNMMLVVNYLIDQESQASAGH